MTAPAILSTISFKPSAMQARIHTSPHIVEPFQYYSQGEEVIYCVDWHNHQFMANRCLHFDAERCRLVQVLWSDEESASHEDQRPVRHVNDTATIYAWDAPQHPGLPRKPRRPLPSSSWVHQIAGEIERPDRRVICNTGRRLDSSNASSPSCSFLT